MSKFVTAKQFFKGFSKVFEGPQHGGKVATIGAVKPSVGKSKLKKALSDVNITALKTKGSIKKKSQDLEGAIRKVETKIGQTSQKLKGEPVTKSGFTKGKDLREKKMGGGMMGRRFGMKKGTNPFKKETNVDKIKKAFAPKSGLKKIDPQKQKGLAKLKKARPDVVRKMGYMKKGGRAGFKGGGADMTNVASDKTKREAKKFEKRAKDASKSVKNIGRSFTSIMNEKYRP